MDSLRPLGEKMRRLLSTTFVLVSAEAPPDWVEQLVVGYGASRLLAVDGELAHGVLCHLYARQPIAVDAREESELPPAVLRALPSLCLLSADRFSVSSLLGPTWPQSPTVIELAASTFRVSALTDNCR